MFGYSRASAELLLEFFFNILQSGEKWIVYFQSSVVQQKPYVQYWAEKKCINYGFDSPCGSSEKEHPADECLFFPRHVPTLVNNFYDNKKLQFFISDFSLPRVTQAAAKCTVLYYYSFLYFCIFLSCSSHDFTKNVKKNQSWNFTNSAKVKLYYYFRAAQNNYCEEADIGVLQFALIKFLNFKSSNSTI